ncbi:MAG: hypothetical protein WDO70_04350 [Alphaproteobacteria bacterium]
MITIVSARRETVEQPIELPVADIVKLETWASTKAIMTMQDGRVIPAQERFTDIADLVDRQTGGAFLRMTNARSAVSGNTEYARPGQPVLVSANRIKNAEPVTDEKARTLLTLDIAGDMNQLYCTDEFEGVNARIQAARSPARPSSQPPGADSTPQARP